MTDVPGYSDYGGFGHGFQEELHGRDHLLDLLLSADVVRELGVITGQACLMHLDSTPQAQIYQCVERTDVPQHYKPRKENLLSYMFCLEALNSSKNILDIK